MPRACSPTSCPSGISLTHPTCTCWRPRNRSVSKTAVRYRVSHQTRYEYSGEVVHSHHLLHLAPRDMPHQRCSTQQVSVEPPPSVRTEGLDAFGNPVTRLEF